MIEREYYNKFNALTPQILKENKRIYTEALDYVFSNEDIKNIAITGIYGAGKSTVWNTYKNYNSNKSKFFNYFKFLKCFDNNKFNNIITISLSKYVERLDNENEKNVENEKGLDSRVEKQLINQILSQINFNNIPLSKYQFKINIYGYKLFVYLISTISFITSILIWILKDEIFHILKNENIFYINLMLFFIPIILFFCKLYKENIIKLLKFNLKGVEVNLKEDKNDETILDRDIKEIVYLLYSSKSTIVVFEDLDRYNNIEIFIKLRELNFLLNSYKKKNGNSDVVRFIYMIKDGLFQSKDRTKFFDFILPIVPVVDSKTSENKLIGLLNEIEYKPSKKLLYNISLYIDDMRLLKNIVNEYIIYLEIIPIKEIDLEIDKLFSLITLKNIFPNIFDQLQEDKGVIKDIFDRLETNRKVIISKLEIEAKEIKERIEFINNKIENDKFETMALNISVDVKIDVNLNRTWTDFLRKWSEQENTKYYISYSGGSSSFNYNEFLDKFIFYNKDKKELIEKIPIDRAYEISQLNLKLKEKEKTIKNIEIFSYKELIFNMDSEQREDLFLIEELEIKDNHYFPLIRYLISDGLLDQTYWYYKGNFDVDTSNILKRNDIIYIKGLLEGKELDVFLDVETSKEIINRLNISDFNRFNILNKNILKFCLENDFLEHINTISNSININNNYINLIKILDEYEFYLVKKYIDILIKENINMVNDILENCSTSSDIIFRNILISILTNIKILPSDLELFRTYIEENEAIISFIPEDEYEIFINNIKNAEIKFESLEEFDFDKDRLMEIEKIKAYKIKIRNIVVIVEKILNKKIEYGSLLNEIYSSKYLNSTWNYIEENFGYFLTEYIDENINGVTYNNSEDILVQIFNSDISKEYKLRYLEKNKNMISNIKDLNYNNETKELFDKLLVRDKMKFSTENIKEYWNVIEEYGKEFIEYIERNINENNCEDILNDNRVICNTIVNDEMISDKLFESIINYVNKKIVGINSKLEQNRVNKLIKKDLLEINDENIEILLNNSYDEELTILANSENQDVENNVISRLLKHRMSNDLIYMLINSEISDENSIELIESIEGSILIEKINFNKNIIKNIIKKELVEQNIDYICKEFESFVFKDEFINALYYKNKLEELEDKNLNENFMRYVLNSSIIDTKTKISLIITKVQNNCSENILKEYILSVDEISNVARVWDNQRPLLNNSYEGKVGEELIKFKYVRQHKDKNGLRIRLNHKK